jgi:succinate dehydrogenase/fumarate reductase flavoprotein subunit
MGRVVPAAVPDAMSNSPATSGVEVVDLLVAGSGAGGLAAALVAASRGLQVCILEKTPWIGGTTALSEGMIWVPGGRAARSRAADGAEAALAYLRAAAPVTLDAGRARAYCEHAAPMLEFLERESPVRFELAASSPDYYGDLPGATTGLRAYRPRPYDARVLPRALFARIRPPLATTVAFGGMMLSSEDYGHVLAMRSSARSFAHVAALAMRYARDRAAGHARGTRLANGNAVIAGLLEALVARRVEVLTRTTLVALNAQDGAVVGAQVHGPGGLRTIRARAGVVLATGGFPGSLELRRRFLAHVADGLEHVSLAPETNTGDGIVLAQSQGARIDARLAHPAAWTPVSVVPRDDGSTVPFPHYVDRAKPGIIAVTQRGERFCNEADPYIRFVPELIGAARATGVSHVWLVCDHAALRAYGIGAVPPAPGRIGPFVRSGYLLRAPTLGELAHRLELPEGSLQATVAKFNADARRGVDPAFGRGGSAFNLAYGDASHAPNPCLGPLDRAPFYAVRLLAGDIGTFVGLAADGNARVLDADGAAIRGLYAAGNDVASPTGGEYPAAGVTVGAALTFGYLAGTTATLPAARLLAVGQD